jgi:glutaminase
VTNAQYLLNGAAVPDTIESLTYLNAANLGMFDINFASTDVVSLYGAQVYDSNTLALIQGVYGVASDYNTQAFPTGSGAGTVIVGVVPEPTSIVSGGLGLFTVLSLGLRRRRVSA